MLKNNVQATCRDIPPIPTRLFPDVIIICFYVIFINAKTKLPSLLPSENRAVDFVHLRPRFSQHGPERAHYHGDGTKLSEMGRRRQPIWCLQDQDRSAMRGHGVARGLKQRSGAQALSRGNNRERPKPSASLPPTPIGFA